MSLLRWIYGMLFGGVDYCDCEDDGRGVYMNNRGDVHCHRCNKKVWTTSELE